MQKKKKVFLKSQCYLLIILSKKKDPDLGY